MRTIFGAIVGDVIGSYYEFHSIKTKSFELFPYGSRFTDDTVMTLAIAKWLMDDETLSEDAMINSMREFGHKYPLAGYGGKFFNWLASDPTPYNSWGNGSAMRVSSVGLWAETLEECLALAEKTAAVSHNHPEGIKGAQAVAACMFIALHWEGSVEDLKVYIKEYVTEIFGYNLDRTLEEIRPKYHFDVSCQGSVPEAIIAFLEGESYEDVIRNAVSLGGDADTQAAIAGSIAACVWPIPDDILAECKKRLPPYLLKIAEDFDAKINNLPEDAFEEDDLLKSKSEMTKHLESFVEIQNSSNGYYQAFKEMKSGGKRGHWIRYIFPQIAGLGYSQMFQMYGIKDLEEAKAYLEHPVLGKRLREITELVLSYPADADPNQFMLMPIDAMKLKSSMTLFDAVSPDDIFGAVLNKFYNGKRDTKTLELMKTEYSYFSRRRCRYNGSVK